MLITHKFLALYVEYPYGTVGTYRERNLLALPTLDMYLPLSKLESIHWVSIDATV